MGRAFEMNEAARLERMLDAWEPLSGVGQYAVRMWRHTLLKSQMPDEEDDTGALPYIPDEVQKHFPDGCVCKHLLDVGSLGGYGLYDVTVRILRAGDSLPQMTGIDISEDSIALAKHMANQGAWGDLSPPAFVVANVEQLPFKNDTFDLVLARLLLPYVNIDSALTELARVSVPNSLLLFQLHAPRYYARQIWASRFRVARMFYYFRPILSGFYCRLRKRQPKSRWWQESALTCSGFSRWVRRYGYDVVETFGDDARPMVLCRLQSCKADDQQLKEN